MVDFFERINIERISLEDAESRLVKFRNLLHLLVKMATLKRFYEEKKAEVLKYAKSLFEGQKLIYSGFIDSIFDKKSCDEHNGSEEGYSRVFSDDDDDNNEFYTLKETLRDVPNVESEESAEQSRNQSAKELKILTPQQMLSRLPISLD